MSRSTFIILYFLLNYLTNEIITSYRGNDWIADRYATSLKMSTYLIAFMVCDFGYTELTTTNGVQVGLSTFQNVTQFKQFIIKNLLSQVIG